MSRLSFLAADEGEVELVNLEFTTRAKTLQAQISLRGRRVSFPIHFIMFVRAIPFVVESNANRWVSMEVGSVDAGEGFYRYEQTIALAKAGLVQGNLFQARVETYSEAPHRGFHEFEIEFLLP